MLVTGITHTTGVGYATCISCLACRPGFLGFAGDKGAVDNPCGMGQSGTAGVTCDPRFVGGTPSPGNAGVSCYPLFPSGSGIACEVCSLGDRCGTCWPGIPLYQWVPGISYSRGIAGNRRFVCVLGCTGIACGVGVPLFPGSA